MALNIPLSRKRRFLPRVILLLSFLGCVTRQVRGHRASKTRGRVGLISVPGAAVGRDILFKTHLMF